MRNLIFTITTVFLLSGCKQVLFEPEPENNPPAVFEALWNDFADNYGPFEQRGVNWDAVYDQFQPKVSQDISDDSLFAVLTSMLAVLDDGHVNLIAPGREVFNSNFIRNNKIYDDLFDIEVVKDHYLTNGFETDGYDGYIHGWIGNTGYIWFAYVGDNFFVMNEVLDTYKDADGLIIDMRHNDGGDFTYCFSEIGRLSDEKRLVFSSRTKTGPGAENFTPWYDWYLEPEGEFFDKKIVILTDRFTISAGERAVMAFDILPNVITAGDTTCGAHSTMVGRTLANGWNYSIATQEVIMADGFSREGPGIAPDIFVRNTVSDLLSGKDSVLDTALSQF